MDSILESVVLEKGTDVSEVMEDTGDEAASGYIPFVGV